MGALISLEVFIILSFNIIISATPSSVIILTDIKLSKP